MQKYALTQLRNEPYTFDLHCAMQLVKHEAALLGKRPSVTFSASLLPTYQQADIVEVQNPIAGQWIFTSDLPALSGGQGVMPRHSYNESLKALFEQGNDALVNFFNGFNNRYYRLYCQTELKYSVTAQTEEGCFSWNNHDLSLTSMLANLYGDLNNNSNVAAMHLIQYTGLLGLKLSCPHALQALLCDYFGYNFEVVYSDVDYVPILTCSITKLGVSGQNNQLGVDALLGKSAVTAFHCLNIMLKPNNNQQFNQIKKDKQLVKTVDSFARRYIGVDIKLKMMIKVDGEYLPGLQLTTDDKTDIRLAQSTWLAPQHVAKQHVVMPLK